ncbi:unnamed protein product [Phyllotreta striolata]|uniref:Pericentriolar material 1 protein C-terminal domain-containing protein n=1 Tax=Phyllotreta striolata TaxID=444603 RepID=A0A9N9TDV3_PHYSR|nr:unnamed protein product [Phyllotreta striolata]
MSQDDLRANKRCTGTVPKQRIRYTQSATEVDRLRSLSNSSADYYHDCTNELRSARRSNQALDSTFQQQRISPVQSGSVNFNSISSSNASTANSRKNSLSSSLKCDNITKKPNKRQIDDKLNQIREYLKITNSLMASIKKVHNQVVDQNDDFCTERNEGNFNLDCLEFNGLSPKDNEPMFQRKSENKRLSPRQNQSNLLFDGCNHKNSTLHRSNRSDIYHGCAFVDKNRKVQSHPQLIPTQDVPITNGDNPNTELDSSDYSDKEMEIKHIELHKHITELQNKKFQIDQFLTQLQNSPTNGEDVERDMMRISAMKAQLKKLRNMLEFVKTPLGNPAELGCQLCSSHDANTSNLFVNASNSIDGRSKQFNKNPLDKTKQNTPSNAQKTILELESKKRELVEIMGKHRVHSSNLNQDLGIDTKSDISFITNGTHDPWMAVVSNESDSQDFSSDEYQNEDVKHNFLSLPTLNAENFEYGSANRRAGTPSSRGRSGPRNNRQPQVSNLQNSHTNQMQEQLEIIRSICDSMLQHQDNSTNAQENAPNSFEHQRPFVQSNSNNNPNQSGYYNWLSTSNMQTQSFMLNTLNQCYQMLWMQQKEMTLLKNVVFELEEKLKSANFEAQTSPNCPIRQQQQRQQQEHDSVSYDMYDNGHLLDSCLNNINRNADHVNHLLPNHIWNGQALNNQVVPGNRANNYWDNFRSYSRQNLLSKNSDVPSVVDGTNFINQCANPFTFLSFSKRNSDTNDNTAQRTPFNDTKSSGKNNEETKSPSKENKSQQFDVPVVHNTRPNYEELPIEKPEPETTEEGNRDPILNCTFDNLKENIYKEVASVISANENRPEFLIKLFRDLQFVKSDNARKNVLHSIERNICDNQTIRVSSRAQEYVAFNDFIQDTQRFLNSYKEHVIQEDFFFALKDFLLNLESFKLIYKDKSSRVNLVNILDNEFDNFIGKSLSEIKSQLLQKMLDLVFGQHAMVDSNEVVSTTTNSNEIPTNGDLAEADQSGTMNDEEGAVGGVVEINEMRQINANPMFDPILEFTNHEMREPLNQDMFEFSDETELPGVPNNIL